MADRVVKYVFRGDISDLQAKMVAAGKSVSAAADRMTGATKEAGKFRQGLSEVADVAGKMGLAAAGGLAFVAKAAMDWETAWAGVTKTVDGTPEQMAALEAELRDLAQVLPATHEEIAGVAEAAGQLGVARDSIAGFTRTMIDLGETTNLSADEAATAIAQMANVMRTAPEDIDNLGSALVALGNDGASTERDIIFMAQSIAGAGAQVGLLEADILAIANAAASMGIEVEAGGTAISRVFTDMAKATAQGSEELGVFAEVAGVSADEFTRAFSEDPAQAFQMFTEGLNRINESGGDVFTTLDELSLSDVRVSRALLGMAASGDLLADSLELGAVAWEENQALALEAAKRYDTTAAQMQMAWNSIKDSAIEFGEAALPILATAAESVAGFAQAIGNLPGPVKAAGTALGGITAILGGGLWFTSKTLNGVADMRVALTNLGVSTDKAGKAMKGLGIAAGAFVAVGAAFAALDAINKALDETLPGMEALTRNLIDLANAEAGASLSHEFDSLAESISRVADGRWDDGLAATFDAMLPGDNRAASLREATAEIEALDTALAQFVASAGPDAAREAFRNLAEAQNLTEREAYELTKLLPQFDEALIGASNSAEIAAGGVGEVGDAAQDAADEVEALEAAITGFRDALSQRSDLRSYRDAIREFAKEAEDAPDKLKRGSAAWDDMEARLDAIASSALDVAEDLGGIAQRRFLDKARREFIDAAADMGYTRGEARKLFNELAGLDKVDPTVDIDVDTGPANAALSFLNQKIDWVARPRQARITVTEVYARHGYQTPGLQEADGGYITGPGGPRDDAIPAWLSNGEYVIKAAAVARYGTALFDRLNSMRYADGGYVGYQQQAAQSSHSTTNHYYADGGPVAISGQLRIPGFGMAEIQGVVDRTVDQKLNDHEAFQGTLERAR